MPLSFVDITKYFLKKKITKSSNNYVYVPYTPSQSLLWQIEYQTLDY